MNIAQSAMHPWLDASLSILGIWVLVSLALLGILLLVAIWAKIFSKKPFPTQTWLLVVLLSLIGIAPTCVRSLFGPRAFMSIPWAVVSMAVAFVAAACAAWAAFSKQTEPTRRWVFRSLLSLLLAFVGLNVYQFFLFSAIVPTRPTDLAAITKVGQPAPDFLVTTIEGATYRVADLRGRVIVLNFFATWCGPCMEELPHVQTMWDKYRRRDDFRLFVVGREETVETLMQFKDSRGFTFPLAPDPDRAVFSLFATQSIPRTYLIGRDGTILYQSMGYYADDVSTLDGLVDAELKKR